MTASAPSATPPATAPRRRWLWPTVAVAVALVAAAWRYWPWRDTESTDDAYIDGDIVELSPSIAGRVIAVPVRDNQHVKKGEVLVELDPAPLQARLDQARAALTLATATEEIARQMAQMAEVTSTSTRSEAEANLQAAQASVAQARAQAQADAAGAQEAEGEAKRFAALGPGSATESQRERVAQAAIAARAQALVSQQRVTVAEQAVAEAQAKLAAADTGPHQVAAARAGIERSRSDTEKARAELAEATLAFSYRTVVAPYDGRVARRAVEPGSYVQPGQALMAVVGDGLWVVANLKENQLARLQTDDHATIRVDAYPGIDFPAHVDSVQPGSGSRFSLLPPENATGNFVKVVQRVPVKLVFDQPVDLERYHLGPGMSVEPTIRVH